MISALVLRGVTTLPLPGNAGRGIIGAAAGCDWLGLELNLAQSAMNPLDDLDLGQTLRGLRAGMKVFGRYTLMRQLGRGGMGVVWLVRDEKLDLEVALKFLAEMYSQDEVAIEDLRRETRRCMKLSHTNVVRVNDFMDDEGLAAIVMEHVRGEDLSARRLSKPTRVFEAAELSPVVEQVCTALGYAHQIGRVVHQDLKPQNLMLTEAGLVKVMDFGIASSICESASRQNQKGGTLGAGTLPFMSPQQLMGYPPSVADDVYALGATLYDLLTGKPPFFRGSLETQIQSLVPPTMRERREELGVQGAEAIPEIWEAVVAACLEKEAEKRPRSMAEVWERLSGDPGDEPGEAGAGLVAPVEAGAKAKWGVSQDAAQGAAVRSRPWEIAFWILLAITGVILCGVIAWLAANWKRVPARDDEAGVQLMSTSGIGNYWHDFCLSWK
jgi:hypothetical protein